MWQLLNRVTKYQTHNEKVEIVDYPVMKWNSSNDGEIINCRGKVGEHVTTISVRLNVIGWL